MDIILDASSLINLLNGEVLKAVAEVSGVNLFVQGLVIDECDIQEGLVRRAIEDGQMTELTGDELAGNAYINVLTRYGLGAGETECIAYGICLGMSVCSDDKAARNAAICELGNARVTGSIGLLSSAVGSGKITPTDAQSAYSCMVAEGGFLPSLPDEYFGQFDCGH